VAQASISRIYEAQQFFEDAQNDKTQEAKTVTEFKTPIEFEVE